MSMGVNWVGVLMLFAAIALLVGTPLLLLTVGVRRSKRGRSTGATVMLASGFSICAAYIAAIVTFIIWVGPYRSGIVLHGRSPDGREYCVVQTYKTLGLVGEPYQVSFYIRDADRVWHWNYLAHEDNAWRGVKVVFADGVVRVSANGRPRREIPMPAGTVDVAAVQQGGLRDAYLPAEFSAEEVLQWHNAKFR